MWGVVCGNWIAYACVHRLAYQILILHHTSAHLYCCLIAVGGGSTVLGPTAEGLTPSPFAAIISEARKKSGACVPTTNVIKEWIKFTVLLLSWCPVFFVVVVVLLSDKHTSQWAASRGGMTVVQRVTDEGSSGQYICSDCVILWTTIQSIIQISLLVRDTPSFSS